jgi:hypothetical protein
VSDGSDLEAEEAGAEEGDPWPARCEMAAVALVAVVACVLRQGVAQAFALSSSPDHVTVVMRLRAATYVLGPFEGLMLAVAALLVALDGISSGERRGPSTTTGRVALVGAVLLAAIIVLASGARLVDVLLGHLDVNASGATPWPARLSAGLDYLGSVLAGVVGGGLALRTLEDGDLGWALGRVDHDVEDDDGDADQPYF